MRRFIAWLGIAFAVGGFIVLALAIHFNIHFLIPIGMIAAAFVMLSIAKGMPSDLEEPKAEDASEENGGEDQ